MCQYYHLFPFEKVPCGSRLIIYGAGEVGQWYLQQIRETGYAEVIAVADRAWDKYPDIGIPLIAPQDIVGLDYDFVQDNQSSSSRGVLRGLHFQKEHPQAKLVRCARGAIFDAAVDLRRDSPSFGRAFGVLLTEENLRQLLVPRGFAHGFLVLSDRAEFCYKCDDFYAPGDEGGLRWDDPDLGIAWPGLKAEAGGGYTVDGAPLILAERDAHWPGLRDVYTF